MNWLEFEEKALEQGYTSICGVDEAGRGPLAGPVCAAAVIACEVVQTLDVGTHIIFVGRVVDAQSLSDEPPLTYAYYHTILKGKTPPRASSYTG